MAANEYNIGSNVRCEMRFYSDVEKTTLADPTAVLFRKVSPTGDVTAHTYGVDGALIRDSLGIFYENVNPDEEGTWIYAFRGTGAVVITMQSQFVAKETAFDIP